MRLDGSTLGLLDWKRVGSEAVESVYAITTLQEEQNDLPQSSCIGAWLY